MEEIIPLIYNGCRLARELETNLPNMANNPNMLHHSCDEIIRVFSAARERLSYGQMILQAHFLAERSGFGSPENVAGGGHERQRAELEAASRDGREVEGSGGGGGGEVQSAEMSEGAGGSRPRRRQSDADKRTIRVPAPRMGNTEIPPEDGYTWRKYGQKEILGSRYPRSYYRCTHQKLYQCPAKKQVQRLDHDPYTFAVTYRGTHSCHMSSTAPSNPPPPIEISQPITAEPLPPPQSTSNPLSHWLSMNVGPPEESSSAYMDIYRDLGIGGGGGGTGVAGPLPSVADLADVMFNSGSSSSNSMELIFSAMEDKWQAGDKQN